MAAEKGKKKANTKPTAYDLYGQAFEALHEREFERAGKLFDEIIRAFPDDLEVLAKARTFQQVCSRALEKGEEKAANPNSVGDLFDLGIYCHNRGEFEQASRHFQKALKLAGEDSDYIYYAMATTKAQQGRAEAALEDLKKAIELNEKNRFFARNDPDFEPLADHESFRQLLGGKI